MSLFKSEIVVDGVIPTSHARSKWEHAVRSGATRMKIKGKALFLHSYSKDNRCVLNYYQNYGGDFCSATFTGEIFDYDEGKSQITGNVTASASVKRFAWGLLAASLPSALLFSALLFFSTPFLRESVPFLQGLLLFSDNVVVSFAGTMLVLTAIAIMCFVVDKRRSKEIMDYLHKFLQEDLQQ